MRGKGNFSTNSDHLTYMPLCFHQDASNLLPSLSWNDHHAMVHNDACQNHHTHSIYSHKLHKIKLSFN